MYIANDIAYVVARNGDTFKDLGKEFDISWKKLDVYKRQLFAAYILFVPAFGRFASHFTGNT